MSPAVRSRRRTAPRRPAASGPGWTFLSNHAHVLLCLSAGDPPPLREVAARVGITERAVQKIVLDLENVGVLLRTRTGRRNAYDLRLDRPLRHPLESHRSVAALMEFLRPPARRP